MSYRRRLNLCFSLKLFLIFQSFLIMLFSCTPMSLNRWWHLDPSALIWQQSEEQAKQNETESLQLHPHTCISTRTLTNYFHNDFRLNSLHEAIHTGCHGASRVQLYKEMERTMQGKSSQRGFTCASTFSLYTKYNFSFSVIYRFWCYMTNDNYCLSTQKEM